MDSFSYGFSSKVTLGWHLCPGSRAGEWGLSLRAPYTCSLPSQSPWQAGPSARCHPKGGCSPQGWQCPPAWLYLGTELAPGAGGGGGGELCETALPYGPPPPRILGHAGPVLGCFGLDFCVPIGSRAVQLSSFHADAFLGNSPVPQAKLNPQGPCVPQPSVPARGMRGWGKEVTVQRIPSLSLLN